MGALEWGLELGLAALLAATLFHALRLERALGVLKRDRAALEALVAGFNASTRQAEAGVAQLRAAADDAGRHLARQIETAATLKDDLGFLIARAGQAADRLDAAVRSARPAAGPSPGAMPYGPASFDRAPFDQTPFDQAPFDQAPFDQAPSGPSPSPHPLPGRIASARPLPEGGDDADAVGQQRAVPRLRSQAERDLMQALRLAR